ncbi:MAG: hypothetical protein LBR16_04240 [Treponema sp.]|jgi:hypothetical protein|nr:hypothetical protein [Treponema sp.]
MTQKQKSVAANIFFYAFSLSGALLFAVLLWNDVYRRLAENNREPIGWVLKTARTVQRQLARKSIWEMAKVDLPLYPGDKIRTGDDSAVRVSFASGDVIDLGSNSIITIELTRENTSLVALESGVVVPVVSSGGTVVRTSAGEARPMDTGRVYAAAAPPAAGPPAAAGGAPSQAPEAGPAPAAGLAPAAAFDPAALEPDASLVMPDSIFEELDVTEKEEPLLEVTSLLPQPANLRPQGTIGRRALAAAKGVVFSWDPVPGAKSYELSLRNSSGILVRGEVVASTSRHVSDIALFLANRSLVWSVQAQGEGNIRSDPATGALTLDLPPIEAPVPRLPERR